MNGWTIKQSSLLVLRVVSIIDHHKDQTRWKKQKPDFMSASCKPNTLSLFLSLWFRISDWLQLLHTHKSWMSKKLDSGAAHPKKRRRGWWEMKQRSTTTTNTWRRRRNTWQRRRQHQQTSKVLRTSTAKTIKQTNKQTKRPKTKQQNLEGRKGEEKTIHTHKPKSILPIALLGKHKLIEEWKHDLVVVLMINLFIYMLFCLHYFVWLRIFVFLSTPFFSFLKISLLFCGLHTYNSWFRCCFFILHAILEFRINAFIILLFLFSCETFKVDASSFICNLVFNLIRGEYVGNNPCTFIISLNS